VWLKITLASQALARGGAPGAKPLKIHAFIVLVYLYESIYKQLSNRERIMELIGQTFTTVVYSSVVGKIEIDNEV